MCVLCVHTEYKSQRLRKAFSAMVHTKRSDFKKRKKKKKVVLIHLQLGHVPLTFFLLADSQLKSGDTPLLCYWQRAMGVGWSGVGGGGTWADGKHTLPVIITV